MKEVCNWAVDYSKIKGKAGIKRTSEGFNSTNNSTFKTECGFEAVNDWDFMACDIEYCPECLKPLAENEDKTVLGLEDKGEKRYEISVNYCDDMLDIEEETERKYFKDDDVWCKSKDVLKLEKDVEQLQARTKEFAEGIVDNWEDVGMDEFYCEKCGNLKSEGHAKDEICGKAEKWLKENK